MEFTSSSSAYCCERKPIVLNGIHVRQFSYSQRFLKKYLDTSEDKTGFENYNDKAIKSRRWD